jgi:retinal rod rhodopsin-sensitive cGMP 3',5'-cyclic phosphodiesterase subunit delta
MRDEATGRVLWESTKWNDVFTKELTITLPAALLKSKAISREMSFSSENKIDKFRLVQTVTVFGQAIEEWKFDFGFVIPNSTNTWQCIIEAGPDVLPASVLSGNVVIYTQFFDADDLICTTSLKVNYE